jgi:thymidylate kinase
MTAQAARMPTVEPMAAVPTPAPGGAITSGLVAVVGCDGTGKSTLTHDLVRQLNAFGPTQRRYLGLVSGETGAKIKDLPLIGVWLERRLAAKAAHAQHMKNKLPGVWGSLIMYGFSVWRAAYLKRVWRLANSGQLVIADRYPQAEITGFRYDGPGLGVERSTHWLVRKLAVREQRLYERMAVLKPTLVIRLDIDLATAYARKPDHAAAELSDKIAVMSQLRYNDAPLVDLDSRAPYADVLDRAMRAIRGASHSS